MRALLQRVSQASVTVEGAVIGQIGAGLLILICAMDGDGAAQAEALAAKVAKLRIFGGAALVVSQFTLAADTSRGNRPGFSSAAPPEIGAQIYERFTAALRALGFPVATGRFGADMAVSLVNDGPVTIWMEI